MQREMNVDCYFGANYLAEAAHRALACIGDRRHILVLVPSEDVKRAHIVTLAATGAKSLIYPGAVIDFKIIHLNPHSLSVFIKLLDAVLIIPARLFDQCHLSEPFFVVHCGEFHAIVDLAKAALIP